MKLQILTAIAAASLALSSSVTFAQQPGVQGTAERHINTQKQLVEFAQDQISNGAEAMSNQDYESAFAYYKSAVDALPSGGIATKKERQAAMDGFCQASVKLTEQRISEGRFQDASTTITVVLEDRYCPEYGPALALQARLNDPTRYNRSLTPGFVANVEEVKKLLMEGQEFYGAGRYDLAAKRYEQVLNIDKYNIAARRGMEQVDNARSQYAVQAANESRSNLLMQVDKNWELPVRKFDIKSNMIIDQPQIDTRGTALIQRKLAEIIIPRIEFSEATIREALDFIRQRAATLDVTEQDPSRKGLNIVLKLMPGAPEESTPITLALQDVPLGEALNYVAKAALLKLKIEPHAVLIVPESEVTDVLITKEYKVPPGFITALPTPSAAATTPMPGALDSGITGGPGILARSNAKLFLENAGVTFPQGASANFLPATSKLIVKNTQANLDLIDTLVEVESAPSQVEIEAKFLEVTQNNLKELGVDWLLGQFALPFGSGIDGGGGTPGFGRSINANSFPFLNPGAPTVPIGAASATSGAVTGGNRSGATAISVNAVDALLFGSPAGPAPGILALAGIFTNPQFQVVLRALNQQKGVDLVSAPKVTTKSGVRANIQIVREFRYPSEYDLPQVTQQPGSIYTPATPTTPTSFETKPVGITLDVEPTVGPDGYTIELSLSPRVVEFEGFINYGSPINTVVTVTGLGFPLSAPFEVTANTINQPVFSTREVTTEVTVYDGATVVLGGLMREDIQKTEDKVPILGDIPLAGRLFRSSADQHIKRNLIIFVTSNLLDPAGQPLVKMDEEGEIVAEPDANKINDESILGDPSTIPLAQ